MTPKLEIITRLPPAGVARKPVPLLFVHGAFIGAWCWDCKVSLFPPKIRPPAHIFYAPPWADLAQATCCAGLSIRALALG